MIGRWSATATFVFALAAATDAAAAPVRWVPAANGQVPAGAVIGGQEPGRQLPVCRAAYNGGVHPGKVVAANCNIGWGGKEITLPQYEVAVGTFGWKPAANGQVPDGSLIGGQEPGRQLPVCRAAYNGGVHPGKIVANNCNIGWGGQEITLPQYEVAFDAGAQQGLKWVAAANGQVPQGALIGGQEPGRQLPVCRAAYNGGVHPGKIVAANCNIGWGGKEITLPQYEVALGTVSWVRAANGQVPPGAVIAGQEPGRPLPLCRAVHHGGVHPGKIVAANCNIGWGGKEITVRQYEVAVLNAPPAPVAQPPVAVPAPAASAPSALPLKWVGAANGQVPQGALIGGQEPGRQLPVCRAAYNGGVHPGKVVAANCNIGWGGKEITLPQYEVAVGPVTWVRAANGQVPPGAVIAGQEPGRLLPLCRAEFNGGVHPGKIVAANCNIGWGGNEVTLPQYEVAVIVPSPAAGVVPVAPQAVAR